MKEFITSIELLMVHLNINEQVALSSLPLTDEDKSKLLSLYKESKENPPLSFYSTKKDSAINLKPKKKV